MIHNAFVVLKDLMPRNTCTSLRVPRGEGNKEHVKRVKRGTGNLQDMLPAGGRIMPSGGLKQMDVVVDVFVLDMGAVFTA